MNQNPGTYCFLLITTCLLHIILCHISLMEPFLQHFLLWGRKIHLFFFFSQRLHPYQLLSITYCSSCFTVVLCKLPLFHSLHLCLANGSWPVLLHPLFLAAANSNLIDHLYSLVVSKPWSLQFHSLLYRLHLSNCNAVFLSFLLQKNHQLLSLSRDGNNDYELPLHNLRHCPFYGNDYVFLTSEPNKKEKQVQVDEWRIQLNTEKIYLYEVIEL